jgi:hypothetical protein
MLDGVANVTIDHNTGFQTGSILFGGDHAPHAGFAFTNNVVMLNESGVTGSSAGEGMDSLKRYFPDATFRRNVIIGGVAGRYPQDNFFPASLQDAGLTIPRDEDFRLTLLRRMRVLLRMAAIRAPMSTPLRTRSMARGGRAAQPVNVPMPTSRGWKRWCGGPARRPCSGCRWRCSSTSTLAIPSWR